MELDFFFFNKVYRPMCIYLKDYQMGLAVCGEQS